MNRNDIHVPIKEGDVLIRRVSNGWIAVTTAEVEPGEVVSFVYEDVGENETSSTLVNLLREQFCGYTQTKRKGGLRVTHASTGYEHTDLTSGETHDKRGREYFFQCDNCEYGAATNLNPELYASKYGDACPHCHEGTVVSESMYPEAYVPGNDVVVGRAQRECLDTLFDHVDDMLQGEDFRSVDSFIRSYPIETSTITMCMGLLTILSAAHAVNDQITELDNARARVRKRVTEVDPDMVEEVMKGLG